VSAVWVLERECGDEGWEIAGISDSESGIERLKSQMLAITTTYLGDDGNRTRPTYSEYGVQVRGPIELGVLLVEGDRTVDQRESMMTPEQLRWHRFGQGFLRGSGSRFTAPLALRWLESDGVPDVDTKT
jgi:hypothetical protein